MNPTKAAFFKETYKATDSEIKAIETWDPTTNCDFAAWVLKGIRGRWFQGKAVTEIRSALLTFNRLKTSPRMKAEGFSTDLLTYESLGALTKVTNQYWELLSNKQKSKEFKGAELLYHEGPWKFYRVFEPQAAVQLGSGSRWCTTQLGTAEDYCRRANLWVLHFYDKPYCQMHVESGQCQDVNNQYFFHDQGGCLWMKDYHVNRIFHKFIEYAEVETFLRNFAPSLEPGPDFYTVLAKKSREVLVNHLSFFRQRVPEIEKTLFSKTFDASEESSLLLYLANFEKAEEFEPYIERDPVKAWCYALNFRKRLPEDKEKLFNGTNYFIPYLNRFGDAATYTFTDDNTVANWIKDNPQVRNASAEKIILKNLYRWDPSVPSRYCRLALKGRWEEMEAHASFKDNPKLLTFYCEEIGIPVVPIEELKVTTSNDEMLQLFTYLHRWCPEKEKREAYLKRILAARENWGHKHGVVKYYLYAGYQKSRSLPEIEEYIGTMDGTILSTGLGEWSSQLKDYVRNCPDPISENIYKIAKGQSWLQTALYEKLTDREPLFEKYLGDFETSISTQYIKKYGVDDEETMLKVLPIYDRIEFAIKKGIRLSENDESKISTWDLLDKYISKCVPQGTRVAHFENVFSKYMRSSNTLAVQAFQSYVKRSWKATAKAKTVIPEGLKMSKTMQEIYDTFEVEKTPAKKAAKKAVA